MSGPGLASLAREGHRMSVVCRGWTGGSRRPRRGGRSRCCPNWWSCVTRDTTPRHQTLPVGCAAGPKIGPAGFARPSMVLAVQRDARAATARSSRQPIGPTIDASLGCTPLACQDFWPSSRDGPARAARTVAETVRPEAITEACQGGLADRAPVAPSGAPVQALWGPRGVHCQRPRCGTHACSG